MSDKSANSSDESGDEALPERIQPLKDDVDHFLGRLENGLATRNVPLLNELYEDNFWKLTDKHYKQKEWPSAEAVAQQVSDHELFIVFYKELYYRHIYARLSPQNEDRKGSWENYCKLLDLIIDDLDEGEDLSISLPPQWIWDLLDEFIYHYQTYCFFRNKALKIQKEKDVKMIKDNPEVFETKTVLEYLHKLIRTSQIEAYLQNPGNPEGRTGGAFSNESVKLMGYFALIQLLRVHSLLGDYRLAMQTIECIDFQQEVPLFYSIPACHVSLYYYMGFAYIMLRRFVDAIRTFSDILVFLSKTSGVNSLSYQYDFLIKKQDQMFVLLLLAHALCPIQLEESLERKLRERDPEKQARLARGEELCFEELFQYAAPKFVSAAVPEVESAEAFSANEAHSRQVQLFLSEVKQQQLLPRIAAYMKLYTAITTSKLAQLCEMDEEALRDQLMCVMHKTRQPVRAQGAPLTGEIQSCSEVEFYLEGNMVHIKAHRTERAHSEVFLEQILKYQDLLRKMGKA